METKDNNEGKEILIQPWTGKSKSYEFIKGGKSIGYEARGIEGFDLKQIYKLTMVFETKYFEEYLYGTKDLA